jgi:hypothetical protein
MDVVFEAEHTWLRTGIALKTLTAGIIDWPAVQARLMREARALSIARHPGSVGHEPGGRRAMGIAFTNLSDRAQDDVQRYVAMMLGPVPRPRSLIASRTSRAPNRPPGPPPPAPRASNTTTVRGTLTITPAGSDDLECDIRGRRARIARVSKWHAARSAWRS